MKRVDGVIEAVRYKGGRIDLVRAYERRGATYSDHVLLDRAALLERLRQGKFFVTGQRKPLMASTFEIGRHVLLAGKNADHIVTTPSPPGQDHLEGVPAF